MEDEMRQIRDVSEVLGVSLPSFPVCLPLMRASQLSMSKACAGRSVLSAQTGKCETAMLEAVSRLQLLMQQYASRSWHNLHSRLLLCVSKVGMLTQLLGLEPALYKHQACGWACKACFAVMLAHATQTD